jgi:carbamoyltransferase
VLDRHGARYRRVDDEDLLLATTAQDLAAGRVVGWFQGRMEFGPRALGSRSILGDPRDPGMQTTMNLKIKFRESFRPFAPVVLEERAADVFTLPPGVASPYMLLVAAVHPRRRLPVDGQARGLARLRQRRSDLPAVTHVDDSARIQTVDARRHGRLRRLLERFETLTGCPVLVNTSFNVRGEPIVGSPEDAWRCFLGTDMDVLVMGDFVLRKEEQPAEAVRAARGHAASFAPD